MIETTIPETFKKYGSHFSLVKRQGRVLLYQLTRGSKHKAGGYEVMVVQQRKPSVMPNGKEMPGGEALPATSHWGIFGWSFLPSELSRAEERFAHSCKHFNVRRLVRRL